MEQEVDLHSAEKKAQQIERRQRRSELEKQGRRRRLNKAITTLIVLESDLASSGSGQAEYFSDFEVQGLKQREGEGNQELFERAVGICRSNGLSAEEVASRIKRRDSRLSVAYNLGEIDGDERENIISRLSEKIADVYKSSVESK